MEPGEAARRPAAAVERAMPHGWARASSHSAHGRGAALTRLCNPFLSCFSIPPKPQNSTTARYILLHLILVGRCGDGIVSRSCRCFFLLCRSHPPHVAHMAGGHRNKHNSLVGMQHAQRMASRRLHEISCWWRSKRAAVSQLGCVAACTLAALPAAAGWPLCLPPTVVGRTGMSVCERE